MTKFHKINLESFDDDTDVNLQIIHRISEELVETGKIPVARRKEPRAVKDATIARTNSYIKNTPDMTMWIRTDEIGEDARIISISESENIGWMVVRCFTARQEYLLEVTANWPLITRLQWP